MMFVLEESLLIIAKIIQIVSDCNSQGIKLPY